MKALTIKFNNPCESSHSIPFELYIDGEKIQMVRRIQLDMSNEWSNSSKHDQFRYTIEKYVDWMELGDDVI